MTQVPPTGYDHDKVTQAMARHEKWLVDQLDVVNEKFRPYLNVSD